MPTFNGFLLAGLVILVFGVAVLAALLHDRYTDRMTRWRRERPPE